jgi:hypothetical protein
LDIDPTFGVFFMAKGVVSQGLSVTLSKTGGTVLSGLADTGGVPLDFNGATQRAVAF